MLSWIVLAALTLAVATTLALARAGRPQGVWWIAWLVPVMALAAVGYGASRDLETQKMLSRMAMPLGLVWGTTGALGWWLLLGRRWAPGFLTLLLFLAITAIGNSWLGSLAIRHQQDRAHLTDPLKAKPMDAVFCMGGGTKMVDGQPLLGASGDRLLLAAKLWRQQSAPTLVASGASIEGMDLPRDLSKETAQIWQTMGIPPAAIARLPEPRNTKEEIIAYGDECRRRGWKTIGIVTSGWHVPRATALALASGLAGQAEIQWFGADTFGTKPPWSAVWVVPDPEGLLKLDLTCREQLGMWMGR